MALRFRHCLAAWVIIGLGFVVPASQRIQDPDIWWHIKTGELISASRAVPASDSYSFTSLGQPWTAHEWLSEVIFFGVFAHFGFIGIIFLRAVLICAMFAAIYVLVRKKLEHGLAALGVTTLCGLAGWQLWSPRPQLFTYLLLAGLLLILGRSARTRALWLAVPTFWLWSNLHGAWLFGFAIMVIILADAATTSLREGKPAHARRMALVCLCSLLVVLVGPSPLERLVYPLHYFTGRVATAYISDFRSPDFWDPMSIPYEILLMGLGALLYLGRKPMRPSEWALLILTFHLSLFSVRHVPLFSIIAAPILAAQFQSALERYGAAGQPVPAGLRESRFVNLLILLMLPVLVWARLPKANDEAHCINGELFPVHAARFLSEQATIDGGKLLNTYNWGGYLIFHLYPKYLVSIDGRADVHHEHMTKSIRALEKLSPNWEKELRALNPDVILWPRAEPLAVLLRRDSNWRVLYDDDIAVIFVRR